jgi:hypothetical protein
LVRRTLSSPSPGTADGLLDAKSDAIKVLEDDRVRKM